MEVRTTHCTASGHREFGLVVDTAVISSDVDAIISFLENAVSKGTSFKPGETVQFGWNINQIRERKDGTLGLYEPTFSSFPIEWVESMSQTVKHLRLQRDTADSFGMLEELEFPNIREGGVLGIDVCGVDDKLVLERISPSGNHSGWFIAHADSELDYEDPKNVRSESLYSIAQLVPSVIMFMALPPGFQIELSPSSVKAFYNGSEVVPRERSFIAQLYSKRKLSLQ